MIPSIHEQYRIFLKPGRTDMRKSINGLSALIQNELGHDPYGKAMFVFCNRGMDIVKLIYWDRNGFCIWQKRLERNRFPWPQSGEEVLEITQEQLNWLLNGIDFRRAHVALSYRRV